MDRGFKSQDAAADKDRGPLDLRSERSRREGAAEESAEVIMERMERQFQERQRKRRATDPPELGRELRAKDIKVAPHGDRYRHGADSERASNVLRNDEKDERFRTVGGDRHTDAADDFRHRSERLASSTAHSDEWQRSRLHAYGEHSRSSSSAPQHSARESSDGRRAVAGSDREMARPTTERASDRDRDALHVKSGSDTHTLRGAKDGTPSSHSKFGGRVAEDSPNRSRGSDGTLIGSRPDGPSAVQSQSNARQSGADEPSSRSAAAEAHRSGGDPMASRNADAGKSLAEDQRRRTDGNDQTASHASAIASTGLRSPLDTARFSASFAPHHAAHVPHARVAHALLPQHLPYAPSASSAAQSLEANRTRGGPFVPREAGHAPDCDVRGSKPSSLCLIVLYLTPCDSLCDCHAPDLLL